MTTPMGKAVVNKMYEDFIEDVNSGKQTDINKALFEINNRASEISAKEKDALKPLAIAEQNKLFIEQEGTYRPPTMIAPERFSKTDGATIEEFQSLLEQTVIDAASAVPKIEFNEGTVAKAQSAIKNAYQMFGISDEVEVENVNGMKVVKLSEKLPSSEKNRLQSVLMEMNKTNAAATLLDQNQLSVGKRSNVYALENFEVVNPRTGKPQLYENFYEYLEDYSGFSGQKQTTKTLKSAKGSGDGDRDKVPTEGEESFIKNPDDPYSELAAKNIEIMKTGSRTSKEKVIIEIGGKNTEGTIEKVTEIDGEPAVEVVRGKGTEVKTSIHPLSEIRGQLNKDQVKQIETEYEAIKGKSRTDLDAKLNDEIDSYIENIQTTLGVGVTTKDAEKLSDLVSGVTDIEKPSYGSGLRFKHNGEQKVFLTHRKDGQEKLREFIKENSTEKSALPTGAQAPNTTKKSR